MSNIKHTLEFIKQEYSKKGYEFLEDSYKNRRYLHNIKCLTCGHIWKQRYRNLQQNHGCPKCAGKERLTLEFVKEEYTKKNYQFLDDCYVGVLHKHNIKCLACGYEWKQRYSNFKQGAGCPKCSIENHKLTLEFVKEEYSKKNYEFLDDYYNNNEYNHNIKCLTCNHKWKQSYSNFQQGRGCPKCYGSIKHTLEFIKEEYTKKGYEFLDDSYINSHYNHNIKCLTCGYEWKQCYHSLKQDHGCPSCLYKNERKCREILEKLTTYKFPKKRFSKKVTGLCRIELDGFCEELALAFEYDGEQHYRLVSNWNQNGGLEKIQARDLFKTDFCLENNIKLIRIPYFVEDKEEFIRKELGYQGE